MFNIKATARKWPVATPPTSSVAEAASSGVIVTGTFASPQQRRRLLGQDMCMCVDRPHVAHFTTRKMPRVVRARSASLPQPVHGRKPLLRGLVWAINEAPLADFRTLT